MGDEVSTAVERIPRQRTFADKAISAVRAAWYRCYEPTMLRIARARAAGNYRNVNVEPLVSVYIPTYNRIDLLRERGLSTVLAQTYRNFELIIVGDCCTDGTVDFFKSFNDPRVRFFNIPKRGYRYPDEVELHWLAGPVVAANTALSMVRGEWIARLDDDDIWTPDHLEKLLRVAQSGDYEFVSGESLVVRDGKGIHDRGSGALDPYHTRKPAPGPDVYNPILGGTATWMYRSYLSFFRYNIDCWRKGWNRVNDLDISIRMFEAGVRMGFLPEIVTHILPRPGESTIGLDAYIRDSARKGQQFSFLTDRGDS